MKCWVVVNGFLYIMEICIKRHTGFKAHLTFHIAWETLCEVLSIVICILIIKCFKVSLIFLGSIIERCLEISYCLWNIFMILFIFFFFVSLTDLDLRYFWSWSSFEDYLMFCFAFTLLCAFITFLFLDWVLFVEALGSLAVMFEAMLGLPQLLQNYNNRSTRGMR